MPRPAKPRVCKRCSTTDTTAFRERSASICKPCEVIETGIARKKRYAEDPILKKANHTINGLQWGRGGTARMRVLIENYLNGPCKYCGVGLDLKNMSLDHKVPLSHAARKPSKNTAHSRVTHLSPEDIVRLNHEDNLHFVCLTCNRMKGNLTDEEFVGLLAYLEDKPRVKQIVCAKLKGSNFMYRKF